MKDKILSLLMQINNDITKYEDINFINEGLLDSLEMFELINALEDEFKIEIMGEDIIPENFKDINAITELVKKSMK